MGAVVDIAKFGPLTHRIYHMQCRGWFSFEWSVRYVVSAQCIRVLSHKRKQEQSICDIDTCQYIYSLCNCGAILPSNNTPIQTLVMTPAPSSLNTSNNFFNVLKSRRGLLSLCWRLFILSFALQNNTCTG